MIVIRYKSPESGLNCTKFFHLEQRREAQDFVIELQRKNVHPHVSKVPKITSSN